MSLASSSYYYQPVTDLPAQAACSDALLRDHIERLQQDFPGYGYRRLRQQLRREGIVRQRQEAFAACRGNTSYFPSAGRASRSPPPIRIITTRSIRIFWRERR